LAHMTSSGCGPQLPDAGFGRPRQTGRSRSAPGPSCSSRSSGFASLVVAVVRRGGAPRGAAAPAGRTPGTSSVLRILPSGPRPASRLHGTGGRRAVKLSGPPGVMRAKRVRAWGCRR
jgi:hypothetical protein